MKYARALEDYIQFFEKLSPRSLKLLEKHVSTHVHFQDPFNSVMGVQDMQHVLAHMFTQLHQPKFKVHDAAQGRQENVFYLKWTFSFVLPKTGEKDRFEGVSEVIFDPKGKVSSHIDYWDPTHPVYMRVPFLKWILGKVLAKLKL